MSNQILFSYIETLELFSWSETFTVKLANFKRLPNRIKYEFVTALELFDYFCVFFIKSSVRFDRTELQNELNMMYSSDEDIELCSVDRFGSIEPNRTF